MFKLYTDELIVPNCDYSKLCIKLSLIDNEINDVLTLNNSNVHDNYRKCIELH